MTGRDPAEVQFLPVADELDCGQGEDDGPYLLCLRVVETVESVTGQKEREDRAVPFWLMHQGLGIELDEKELEALLDPREALQRNGS